MIQKEEVIEILERFPEQNAFLKAVGRQRLQTSKTEDLLDDEDNELNILLKNQSLLNELNDEIILEDEGKFSKIKSMTNLSMQIKKYNKRKKKRLPCNVTDHYPLLDRFIIIPFSIMFYIWACIMLIGCSYTLFIVPFSIAYEYELDLWLLPIDI